jgi:MtN3 and saliva related transmembrane protein
MYQHFDGGHFFGGDSVMFEIIWTTGSLIVSLSSLPQILKTYRTRKAGDLSISYLAVLLLGMTLILVYAIHTGDLIFIFGNLASVLLVAFLIVLLLLYRR